MHRMKENFYVIVLNTYTKLNQLTDFNQTVFESFKVASIESHRIKNQTNSN